VAVASPSASAPGSENPAPSGSVQPTSEPDPTVQAGSILFAEADGLRIRAEASESGEVEATIRRGQLMAATGARQTIADMDWYQVRIGPDLEGWVAAGPDHGWLRLVEDGAVTFACSGCGESSSVVSVTPFGDADLTTVGSAEDELIEWSWSPDGTRLVAARGMTTLPSRIVVLDGDGTELANLGIGAGPTWSPDGARLAWIGDDGLIVTDDELAPTTVDIGGLSNGAPFWSPDGTRFALVASEDPGAIDAPVSLFVVPATGGEAVRLTEPGYLSGITWSPDGSTIAYVTVDLSGVSPSRAFMVPADGGEPQALLDGAAVLLPPIWSPAGDSVALVTPDGIALGAGDVTGPEILVATASEEFIGEVSWSPSGRWLLYSLGTGREPSLWIVPADGSTPPAQISPDGAGGQQADWQPILRPLR
jgi:Tol biopolymer transport system component